MAGRPGDPLNPPAPATRWRLVPLVVACPMFLQNVDSSALGTALPAIAASLDADVLHLNLAITCYLISLVIVLPASAWLADRFGPRRVFCAALLLFTAASALCAAAGSLAELVAYRLLQGAGGALMVPVGRLILLRTVPAGQVALAMLWFTVPGGLGRLLGPLLGGAVVSVASWRWIFLISIPFGLASVVLALKFIDDDPPAPGELGAAPDLAGLALLALALGCMLGALEMVGKALLPWPAIVALAATGIACLWLYLRRSRAQAEPLIDFGILRYRTFRTSVIGGMPLRVAIGAIPFLLPLLFQLGLGMTAWQAGLLMVAAAAGSLGARAAVPAALARFGHRRVLILSALMTSLLYGLYLLFTPASPWPLVGGVLVLAGLTQTVVLVILATIGYSDIPRPRMGHATALATMAQQLGVALGVAVAALLLELSHHLRGGAAGQLDASDFRLTLLAMAASAALSAWAFKRLPREQPPASPPTRRPNDGPDHSL